MTSSQASVTGRPRLLVFTNLYPSAAKPRHGLFIAERVRRLSEEIGFEPVVVCPVPAVPRPLRRALDKLHASMPETEVVDGVTVHHPRYRHLPGVSTKAQARRMAKGAHATVARILAESDGPVVIDAHYLYPDGVAAAQIARDLGVPFVLTARGTDLNVLAGIPAIRRQMEELFPIAHARFAVSRPLVEKFSALVPGKTDARLARNGVDFDRFRPGDPITARQKLGLPEEAALVCGVGRLIPGKGFLRMARALHQLPKAVHFAVAGEGPQKQQLEEVAPPGRIHLLGSRSPDDVAELYRASDLMVLPSEREGWPNVVTEALASGLRVVATPVGSIPDMLTEPFLGSLVRGEAVRPLASEVERHLRSPHDPERVRAFAQRWSWEEPIQTLGTAFRSAIE